MQAPDVTTMRLPVFSWTAIVKCLPALAGFSALRQAADSGRRRGRSDRAQ
jgi:hypothetical protein